VISIIHNKDFLWFISYSTNRDVPYWIPRENSLELIKDGVHPVDIVV
jgi:hypothetical protein